ncbi:MAG: glutathione peroxidase [Enterococcus sp.]
MSIYDFQVTLETGETYQLAKYQGQPLVIVNTATKCGLAPQFDALEKIYATYRDQGLVVLGFPSNQFMQEVKDSHEAAEACRMTYGVKFPMHEIGNINGANAQLLFKYLQEQAPGTLGKAIKWNFTKFLVNRNGQVIKRYSPQTTPDKMIPDIEQLL